MSAFVASKKTIDRVVSTLISTKQYGYPAFREFAGIPTVDPQFGTRVGSMLWSMNVDAVNDRYNEAGPTEIYRFTPDRYRTDIKGLKAMQCLRYQCSEGNIPDRPLFKELDEAIATLACLIVSWMPEYDKAAWDAEEETEQHQVIRARINAEVMEP